MEPDSTNSEQMAPMPRYLSHKRVWALKIKDVQERKDGTGATLIPEDAQFSPIEVSREWMEKRSCKGEPGYFVQYEGDGYTSWSPVEAFEKGYTRIPEAHKILIMPPDAPIEQRIENWFTYHPPTGDQVPRYNELREAAKTFALAIARLTPSSPDQTVAIRHVRDAVMVANASIACGGF